MNDTLTTFDREAREAISRLRDEADRLDQARKAALAAFRTTTNGNGSAPGRTVKKAKSRRGRPKGSGKRAQQALEIIREKPGITLVDVAKEMGIKPNYLYRVVPSLPVDKTENGGLVAQQ